MCCRVFVRDAPATLLQFVAGTEIGDDQDAILAVVHDGVVLVDDVSSDHECTNINGFQRTEFVCLRQPGSAD
jgi:hypothetical protein